MGVFHMKLAVASTGLSLIGLSALVATGLLAEGHVQSNKADATTQAAVPVVVELFTSEGCSSCPPADALLAKMETTQPFKGVQIIAIEEHVDYWDQQGWVDPFSSNEWTVRQQVYAGVFRHDSPYTPQMVVNGRSGFVGSRADEAIRAVQASSAIPPVPVTVSATTGGNPHEPHFAVSVGKIPELSAGDSAEVWLALIESGLASQVSGGENA